MTAATGVRGWSLGGLPAALWVERHEPAVAAATCWYLSTWEWLAFRLTGIAAALARPRPGRRRTRPAWPAAGVPLDRLPPRGGDGRRRRRADRRPPPMHSACGPGSRSSAGTVDAFASYLGAGLLEPGDAYDPGGSAGGFGVYWDRPVEVAGRRS